MAVSEAASEATWLNRQFAELMTNPASNHPQLICIDNSGAISLYVKLSKKAESKCNIIGGGVPRWEVRASVGHV